MIYITGRVCGRDFLPLVFRVILWLPDRCERPVQVHYTHSGWSGDESKVLSETGLFPHHYAWICFSFYYYFFTLYLKFIVYRVG